MKVLKILLKIILTIALVLLALIGVWALVNGGLDTFKSQFSEVDKNIWEFVKWFFSSMFTGSAAK